MDYALTVKTATVIDVYNGHVANTANIIVAWSSLSAIDINRGRYQTHVRCAQVKWINLLSLNVPAC